MVSMDKIIVLIVEGFYGCGEGLEYCEIINFSVFNVFYLLGKLIMDLFKRIFEVSKKFELKLVHSRGQFLKYDLSLSFVSQLDL